jgi:hypothetical protein
MAIQVLHDLNGLTPEITFEQCFDRGERFMFLDYVVRTMTGRLHSHTLSEDELVFTVGSPWATFAYDANVVLRRGNKWYDERVAALGIEDRRARRRRLLELDEEWESAAQPTRELILIGLFNREVRSEHLSNLFYAALNPAPGTCARTQDRDAVGLAWTRIAASLAIYRARHGAYPVSLDNLVPEILPAVPSDSFTAAPPRYEGRGEGYLLYSVFENGVDDGGDDFSGKVADGEWVAADPDVEPDFENSDFVIRMPRPRRPWPTKSKSP